MAIRINGAATAHQNLTENLQYYLVWAKAPKAFSDPEYATGVDILATGNYHDITQKNFEVLVMSVGLRAMPVIMSDPCPVQSLELEDAKEITGEGYIWKFAVERSDYFKNTGPYGTISDVGFLIDELHGIILPNGIKLETTGPTQNIEFRREALWGACTANPNSARIASEPEEPICDSGITYSVGKKGK